MPDRVCAATPTTATAATAATTRDGPMTARARWRRAGRRLVHVLRFVGWGAPGKGSLRERAAIATDERFQRRFHKFMGRADDLEAGRCDRQEFAEEMAKVEGDAHEAVARAKNRERWRRRDLEALTIKYTGVLEQLATSREELRRREERHAAALHTARQQLHSHYAAVEQQNLRLKAEVAAAEAQRIAAKLEHERDCAASQARLRMAAAENARLEQALDTLAGSRFEPPPDSTSAAETRRLAAAQARAWQSEQPAPSSECGSFRREEALRVLGFSGQPFR